MFYLQYLEIELGVYSWPLLYTNLPPVRFQHRLTQGSFQSTKRCQFPFGCLWMCPWTRGTHSSAWATPSHRQIALIFP